MSNIIAFDLNKTLIQENSWYDLNLAMGITAAEDEMLYRWGPEGERILNYTEWIDILCRLMKARGIASRKAIEDVILDYTYIDGTRETVKAMQNRGFKVGIITGALSLVADNVSKELALDFVYCNAMLGFDSDDMLQTIRLCGEDFAFKVDAISKLRQKYSEAQVIYYIADGDTGQDIFEVTKGIMVTANQWLHEDWKKKALESGDEFSVHRATKNAWKIIDTVKKVPELI